MDLLVATLLFGGTFLQMTTSVKDFNASRTRELEWWNTEDALVAEIRFWRPIGRLRARRDLRKLREPDIQAEIQHMTRVFMGWIMLWLGSVLVLLQAVFK